MPILLSLLALLATVPGAASANGQYLRLLTGEASGQPARQEGGFGSESIGASATIDPVTIVSSTNLHPIPGDDIDVSTRYQPGGFSGTLYFQMRLRLLDEADNPVVLVNASPGATTFIQTARVQMNGDFPFPIDVNLSLDPAVRLDVDQTYRVEASVICSDSLFNPVTVTIASRLSDPAEFLDFPDLPQPEAVNVMSRIDSVVISQVYALRTGDDSLASFRASVRTTHWRWDVPGGVATDPVGVFYDVELFEVGESNNLIPVPLELDVGVDLINLPRSNPAGTAPSETVREFTFRFRVTDETQLDPVNGKYLLRAMVSHNEIDAFGLEIPGNTVDSPATGLIHYSGQLDIGGYAAEIQRITLEPTVLNDNRPASIELNQYIQEIDLRTAENRYDVGIVFAGEFFDLRLTPDGNATLLTNGTWNLTPQVVPDLGQEQDIYFQRSNLRLTNGPDPSNDRVRGDVELILPAGLGFTLDPVSQLLDSRAQYQNIELNLGLRPVDELLPYDGPGGPQWFSEETKPVRIETSGFVWETRNGRIELFVTGRVFFEREDEYAILETAPVIDPALNQKRSNALYYRRIQDAQGTAEVFADSNGGALLSCDLTLGGGELLTHFPYNVAVDWGESPLLLIRDDLVDASSGSESYLDGPGGTQIAFARDCFEGEAGGCANAAPSDLGTLFFDTQDGRYLLTPDGGFAAAVQIIEQDEDERIQWGLIEDSGNYAHRYRDSMTEGTFLAAGHFVRGIDLLLDPIFRSAFPRELSPGAFSILNTGFFVSDLESAERPTQNIPGSPYATGQAAYPGLNVRADTGDTFEAESLIQGSPSGNYEVRSSSRLYLRFSGVSGLHSAEPGTFPEELMLAGYEFDFSNFSLSFLSGKNRDSRTRGAIDFPFPSGFLQPFEQLRLSCRGGLSDLTLPRDQGTQIFQYWTATVQPVGLTILNQDGTEASLQPNCDPAEPVFIAMPLSFDAEYIANTLGGTVDIKPDGNFRTPQDVPGNPMTSRFVLSGEISLPGPLQGEAYTFHPVTPAFFNNFDFYNNETDPLGFVAFAGDLDVALFESFETVVHVPAKRSVGDPGERDYFVMGPDFDNRNDGQIPARWDWTNRGFPFGTTLPDYRDTTPPTEPGARGDEFLPYARHEFIDDIRFNLPVAWNSGSRTFRSIELQRDEFLVLSLQNQVPYLSPGDTEVRFTGTASILPFISLTNLTHDRDVAPALRSALDLVIGNALTDDLVKGDNAFDTVLSDSPWALYSRALSFGDLNEPLNPILEARISDLVDQLTFGLANGWDPAMVDQALERHFVIGDFFTIREALTQPSAANPITASVQAAGVTAINDAIAAIDAMLGSGAEDGLLAKTPDGNYRSLGVVVREIIRIVLDDTDFDFIIDLVGDLGSLDDKIVGLYATTGTALEAQRAGLDRVRALLLNLRDEISFSNGEITAEIRARVDSAVGTGMPTEPMSVALTNVRDKLRDYLQQYSQNNYNFDRADPVALKRRISAFLIGELRQLALTPQIQSILRRHLFDANEAMRYAIDSTFQTVNQIGFDLITELSQFADEQFVKFLGQAGGLWAARANGYAHYVDDSIRQVRVDFLGQFSLGFELLIEANLTIDKREVQASEDSCSFGVDGTMVDTRISALTSQSTYGALFGAESEDVGKFSIDFRMLFFEPASGGLALVGAGGGFALEGTEIDFGAFKLKKFFASAFFGALENYVAGGGDGELHEFGLRIAAFLGKACELGPLLRVDPDSQLLVGDPPYDGIYFSGGITVPFNEFLGIPSSCFLTVKASLGGSYFFFFTGPTFGLKYQAGLSGEVLCIAEIGGEITIGGSIDNFDIALTGNPLELIQGDIRAFGRARVWAKLCLLLCVEVSKSLTVAFDVNLTTKDVTDVSVSLD